MPTPPSSFRLKSITLEKIDLIAEARDGLTRTRGLELAVNEHYRKVFLGEFSRPRPTTRTAQKDRS